MSARDVSEEQAGVTVDTISGGAIEILQREEGYRFGLDGVLLATELPDLPEAPTIVELGAGQGVVALCIASRIDHAAVTAFEVQETLFELLEANIARNELGDRVEAIRGDVRQFQDLLEPHSADLVVCNPPYYRQGERRMSDDEERAVARNELEGTLVDFVQAAHYVLDQRGRLKLILPPLRLGDLYAAAEPTDLSFESLRFFHSRRDSDAYLVEALLRRGGAPDVRIRPPLYVYAFEEEYGPEVRKRIDEAGAQR